MSPLKDDKDPAILVQYAAGQLKDRTLSLSETAALSTAQVMILLGWRDSSRGHARRATCYIGYTCRIVARQHQKFQKQDRLHDPKLNGVGMADVEKEILQTFTGHTSPAPPGHSCKSTNPSRSSALMGWVSPVWRKIVASDNISTLHSQIQTMRWMWPLGLVTSIVAHIYKPYLNTQIKDRNFQPASSCTRSLEIRDILNQFIRLVEREVTTPNLKSFLLTTYHTIVIHMVFSPEQIDRLQLHLPQWTILASPYQPNWTLPSAFHPYYQPG